MNAPDSAGSRRTFIKRITLITVVVNLIFISLAGLSLYQSWLHYEERAERATQNLSRVLAIEICDAIDKIDLTVLTVADEVEKQLAGGRIDTQSLNGFIARCQTRLPVLDGLRVVNAQGENAYGTDVTPSVRTSVADRNYFTRLRTDPTAGLVISEPVVGRVSKKWSIIFARRVNQPDGSFAGVVYGTIALEYFAKTFSTINLGKNGSISLRGENLALIIRYPEPKNLESIIGKQNATPELQYLVTMQKESGSYRSALAFDKIQRTYSFQKLPHHPLYVTVGQRPLEYLAPWRNDVIWIFILTTFFFLGMVTSAWLVFRDWIRKTKAIQALAQEQEALRKSQEQHQVILQTAMDGFWIVDLDGHLLEVNDAYCRMSGYNPQELLTMHISDLIADMTPAEAAKRIRTIMAKGEERFESQHRRQDGSIFEIEASAQFRPAEKHIVAFLRDVTARKQVDRLLQNSNQRLEETLAKLQQSQTKIIQQEKQRSLGQMASGIAHDFNNSLSPILGFSEFLLKHPEKLADHAQVTKWLTNIHTAALDAAGVVKRIREFSQQKQLASDALSLVDPNQLILQTIEMTEPSWKDQAQATGRTIHFATDLQPLPFIIGEAFAIRELLTNLIFNALDAMPQGGTLTLRTKVAGEFVRVSVTDTGTGMTEEVRQRCLEPFFTTKGTEGTGLGLAMVSSIVQRHTGRLEIESTPGQGTTVIVRLPIPSDQTPTKVSTAPSALPRSLRVLVVDDEPLVCEIVKEFLSSDGHLVEIVENAAAALARLKNGPFDLVLTDRAMPKMSGEQLAVVIHQNTPNLPVILMTGFGDIMKADGAKPPHIRGILSKPITETTLRETLAEVFRA